MPWSLLLVMHHHLLCRVKLFWTEYRDCLSVAKEESSTETLKNLRAYSVPFLYSCSGYPHMLVCSCKYLTLGDILTLEYSDASTVNLVAWFYIIWLYKCCSALCVRDWSQEFFLVVLVVYFLVSQTCGCFITEVCKTWLDRQPGLVEDVPVHGKGVGTKWSLGSLPKQTILWFWCNFPVANTEVRRQSGRLFSPFT